LKYEGEYLNGKKNGIWKEYFIDGNLKFEGKYLYRKKIGKEYYRNGKLKYEGEINFIGKIQFYRRKRKELLTKQAFI